MTRDPRTHHLGLELHQVPTRDKKPATDDRFMYQAAQEIFGPTFVLDAGVSASVLSRIAQRAAELKTAHIYSPPEIAKVLANVWENCDLAAILTCVADCVYQARLKTGRKISDVLDFHDWLRELAEEARKS